MGRVGDASEAENAGWSFGCGVAEHFDEHVSRSVPLYRDGHEVISRASDFFLSDGSVCYDLGCSTGTLLLKLADRNQGDRSCLHVLPRPLVSQYVPSVAAWAKEGGRFLLLCRVSRSGGVPELFAPLYHSAWEVGELTDLVRARRRLIEAGSLVGSSDHGVSLSLYAKDPDGLEFEVFWTVPDGRPVPTRALDLEGELARRGIPMPKEIDVAPST